MTEDEALVWYEADGTRHVLGDVRPEPVRDTPPEADAPEIEHAEPVVEPAEPVVEPVIVPVTEPAAPEPTRPETVEEPEADDPSALSGMVRALLLGAAAAAATGAVVGAISLASTGDRPDTTEETVVPATVVTEAVSAGSEPSPTTVVETIELDPATTSADQPG